MASLETLPFDNAYARLPEAFFTRTRPLPLEAPRLASACPDVATLLGLAAEELARPELVEVAAGARLLPGMEPLAMVYAGHQFGTYVPRLGDGRAVLLGQVRGVDGRRYDLHLKGGGPTAYSRGGDGRAVLRSTVREYLAGEALHALGIPTTRALCMVASRTRVWREEEETGAALLRVAESHVRFGTFEYFRHTGQPEHLRTLADAVLAWHFPHLLGQPDAHARLYAEVVERTAHLVARWQAAGFAHGVLNTDNMSVLGLTLDYGPYGFLDAFDAGFVPNHSDFGGRYAFGQQPHIGLWNLARLGEALLGLVPETAVREALDTYPRLFREAYLARMREKLGLCVAREDDVTLVEELLGVMAGAGVDHPGFFRALARVSAAPDAPAGGALRSLFPAPGALDAWLGRYLSRVREEGRTDAERRAHMDAVNPLYVLRNSLAEQAIRSAEAGDFGELERLVTLLRRPFTEVPGMEAYAAPPPAWGRHLAISCSS